MDEIIKMLTERVFATQNKIKSAEINIEKVKGTQLEKDLSGGLEYLKAAAARLAVCLDILEGRAFVLYQEEGSKDLIVARPNESTAALLKRAEEMGARLVEYHDLKPGHQPGLI